MASNSVIATLTVNFQTPDTSGDGFLTLEIDDRESDEGGLNIDTSFSPGQDVYVLMFKESTVKLDNVWKSAPEGTFVSHLPNQIKHFDDGHKTTEYLTVSGSKTANLGHPANISGAALSWLGTAVRKDGVTSYTKIPSMFEDPLTAAISEVIIGLDVEVYGIIKAEYSSSSTAYKLSGIPKTYPMVMLVAFGTIGGLTVTP